MKCNKKGVSLISIIITVLIMAILAAVIIPSGIDKINDAKLTSFNDNIMTLKQEANMYLMKNDEYPTKVDGSGNPVVYSIVGNTELVAQATKKGDKNDTFYVIDLNKLNLDNKDNGVGKTIDDYYIVAKMSGNVYYAKGLKIGNVIYYIKQNKGDGVVAVVPTSAPTPSGGWDGTVNSPKLAAGMIPVKWNGSAWVDLASTEQLNANHEWYDYSKPANKWANVRLKDNSLLVWIPRYTYKINPDPSLLTTDRSVAGDIDVKFTNRTADDTLDGYKIHPAFYWGGWTIPEGGVMVKQGGGTELTGIWVGKFEPSPANGQQGTSGDKIAILPNKASWRTLTINDIFTKCLNMKNDNATYGDLSTANTHMLKNSEWGAVAYLSKYALGSTEVAYNPNSSFITANGDIVTYKAESTTGNEYGIYDMSGGSYEYVAAYVNNSNAGNYGNSAYTTSKISPQYADVFPKSASDGTDGSGNYAALSQAYGHAIYETSNSNSGNTSWFSDYSNMPYNSWPWLIRSGRYNDATNAGLFYFYMSNGNNSNEHSFRVGIVIP